MQLVLALVSLNAGKLRDGQNLHEKKKNVAPVLHNSMDIMSRIEKKNSHLAADQKLGREKVIWIHGTMCSVTQRVISFASVPRESSLGT